jgi:hypothetical protein
VHPEARHPERHGAVRLAARRVPQRSAPRPRGPNRGALLAIVDVASAGLTPEAEPAPAVALEAIVDLASAELERQEQVVARRGAEEEKGASPPAPPLGTAHPDEEQRFDRWLAASEHIVTAHKDESGWEDAPVGVLGRLADRLRKRRRVAPAQVQGPAPAEPAPEEAQILALGIWDPVPEGRRKGR